jgi:protoporphyrinogen/coproporphyrinogen III oxidase
VTDKRAGGTVAILGGGVAGMTAAADLRRRGIRARVYEAGPRIAGLAASFKTKDGFSNDFGAHFVTNRLAAAIGVDQQCRDVRHYGEAVWVGGRIYGYPFGLLRNHRFLLSAAATRMRLGANGGPPGSVADWFRHAYGPALAETVAIPLVEAWSGAPADRLSPAVATEKLRHGVLHTIGLKLASRVMRRAVANGYSHERPESPSVWHVYPEGGVGTLVERLADGLEDTIALESPVEAILVEDDRVVGIRVHGREEAVDAVISTAPCNVLPRLVRGTSALQYLSRFRFRPMVFVNFRLRGRGLLPDTVLWIPQREFPFFRLTETTRSMPWLAPEGKSIVTVDIGCEVQDELWKMPDDRITQLCLEHLSPIIPGIGERFLGADVLRTPIAYPVYLSEYEADRLRFRRSTGVRGLYSIGRNGEFAHILMEDVYWRTLARMDEVVRDLDRGLE